MPDVLEVGTPWYFVRCCPLIEECSAAAFKRSKVWGWTICECQNQLRAHLGDSGNHSSQDAAAVEVIVGQAKIEVHLTTHKEAKEHDAWMKRSEVPSRKRPREASTNEALDTAQTSSGVSASASASVSASARNDGVYNGFPPRPPGFPPMMPHLLPPSMAAPPMAPPPMAAPMQEPMAASMAAAMAPPETEPVVTSQEHHVFPKYAPLGAPVGVQGAPPAEAPVQESAPSQGAAPAAPVPQGSIATMQERRTVTPPRSRPLSATGQNPLQRMSAALEDATKKKNRR